MLNCPNNNKKSSGITNPYSTMKCACKWYMTVIWRLENGCLLSILVGLVTVFAGDCDKLFVVISLTNWSIDHSCLRLLWSALANFFKTWVKTETSIKKRQILVKTFDCGDSILWSICLFWRINFSIYLFGHIN